MRTTIGYCGCHPKPKLSVKTRIIGAVLLFPWSFLLIPAWKVVDVVSHALGGCLGSH